MTQEKKCKDCYHEYSCHHIIFMGSGGEINTQAYFRIACISQNFALFKEKYSSREKDD